MNHFENDAALKWSIVNRIFSLILELRGTTALPVEALTYFTIHDVFELNFFEIY